MTFSTRLRSLRLARGWSLEELAERMGRLVSKVALSKYERGLLRPSDTVAVRLAGALGVRPADLFGEPRLLIEFLAYRKKSRFRKKDGAAVEETARGELEQRARLQDLLAPGESPRLPPRRTVLSLEEAEEAALALRRFWGLGLRPVPCMTDLLEENLVHAILVEAPDTFDGLSVVARRLQGRGIVSAAAVARRDACGERQRMSLAHELGHLVLTTPAPAEAEKDAEAENGEGGTGAGGEAGPGGGGVVPDEEKAAYRFGSAFLLPAEALFAEVGRRRTSVALEELFLLRRKFAVSLQALVYRMKSLEVIPETHATEWWKFFARQGWRRCEPGQSPPEESTWVRRRVLRALAEGLLTQEEALPLLPAGAAAPEEFGVEGLRPEGACLILPRVSGEACP